MRGHESYELLSAAFSPVFEELNEALADPNTIVDGEEWELDIGFGSDYTHFYTCSCACYAIHERIDHMVMVLPIQFLLLTMGMNNATSTYSCLWCTVRSSERYVYM